MNKFIFQLIIFVSSVNCGFGQMEDFQWIVGYNGDGTLAGVENSIFDFNSNELKIKKAKKGISFFESNSSVCDSTGNLLLFTNGCQVNNIQGDTIQNGDTLNTLLYKTICKTVGANTQPDGVITLPFPEHPGQYFIFTIAIFYSPVYNYNRQLSASLVDINENNGLGTVLYKNKILLDDTLSGAQLKAVKHGNGRDWWIVQQKIYTDKYFFFLLDPTGVKLHHTQEIGQNNYLQTNFSQAEFSPNGKMFARYNVYEDVFLFDFDRSNGMLSNFRQIPIQDTSWVYSAGLIFSPNNQFLYTSNALHVYQFDLTVSDIEASRETVAVYDGSGVVIPYYLGRLINAPDGRIFLSNFNGSEVFHIIQSPNKKGTNCNLQQHAYRFPDSYFFVDFPDMPNFRLGPLDGSPADTLGIDNRPWAHWRWRSDTLAPKTVYFKDLSACEPTNWHWAFGDGTESTDTSPTHTYASPGTYTVCEVVWNQYATDTFCREVVVQAVSIPEVFTENDIKTAPNPVVDEWRLYFTEPLERETKLEFYDIGGRKVFSEKLVAGTIIGQVSLGGLPRGIYFWQLSQRGVLLKNGRVVKVE